MHTPPNTLEAADAGPRRLRVFGADVWVFSALLCLMYMGMMHDFRSAGLTEEEVVQALLDGAEAVEKDMGGVPVERKAAFALSGVLAVYCLATRRRDAVFESTLLTALIAAFLAVLFASYVWSESRLSTGLELVRISVYAMLAFGMALRFTAFEIAKILTLSCTLSVAVACATVVAGYSPAQVDGVFRLSGSLHPNVLAKYATFVIIGSLGFARIRRGGIDWRFVVLAGLMTAALLLTRSRTSLACCVVGVAAYYALGMTWRQRVVFASLGAVVMGGALVAAGLTGGKLLKDAGQAANMGRREDAGSLNGRLPLWEKLYELGDGHYVQGFGYGAFWTEHRRVKLLHALRWAPGHAHNVVFETMLHTGLIGAALVVSIGWTTLFRLGVLGASPDQPAYRMLFAMMVTIVASSFTTTTYIMPREMVVLSGVLVVCAALAPRTETTRAATTRRAGVASGGWGATGAMA